MGWWVIENSSFPFLFDFWLRLRTWDLDSGLYFFNITDKDTDKDKDTSNEPGTGLKNKRVRQ